MTRSFVVVLAAVLVAAAPSGDGRADAARTDVTGVAAAPQVLVRTHLKRPTALAFHPRDGSLWIVNHGDDSFAIVDRPTSTKRRVVPVDDTSRHYLWRPSGLAFSRGGAELATSQDVGGGRGFMGPTLWPGARSKFKPGTILQQIHLDMLHHSPDSVGIAAGADEDRREYWVFNGNAGSIDRYFFNQPHPPGANDHGDGLAYRYATGELARAKDVPGHLALDRATGDLYIADTGNGRVARLRTSPSTEGARMIDVGRPLEGPLYLMPEATVETVVPSSAGLRAPSGLVLHAGSLWVGDHATGRIHVFRLDGTPVRIFDTRLGRDSLTGIALRGGWIYALDARRHRLVRLRASG